jgi:hypothetical protein
MAEEKQGLYNYGTGVIHGKLCNECVNNKTCTDKGCPVYKWRKDK